MKKYVSLLAIAALICVFFASSCKQDSGDEEHTDPAFLQGTWASANSGEFTFTIKADLSFECVLKKTQSPTSVNAKIKGNLAANESGLGPNDYRLRNLETTEDETYTDNATIESVVVGSMNDILVTLTPKENNSKFTFSSADILARSFFGRDGDFVKKP